MTAEQIAEYVQVEVKTIRKWTSDGRIPHSKLGSAVRYRKDEIDTAIKEGSLKAKTKAGCRRRNQCQIRARSLRRSLDFLLYLE